MSIAIEMGNPAVIRSKREAPARSATQTSKPKTKLEAKRDDVKGCMGNKLICHPGYRFDPRHSNNPDIYGPARQPYLHQIAQAAQRDREKNPAYIKADAIRNAHKDFAQ